MSLRIALLTLSWSGLFWLAAETSAAEPAPPDKHSLLMQRAFEAEIKGDRELRDSCLKNELSYHPENPLARWQTGQVQLNGAWTTVADSLQWFGSQSVLEEYRQRRVSTSDNPRTHRELADWCRDHGLPLQEQAHLTRALELGGNFSDLELRARLGFQFLNGEWVTRRQREERAQLQQELADSFELWQPRIQKLVRQLDSPRFAARQAAREELRQITDPLALPALEAALANVGVTEGKLLVELLAAMPSHRAAEFLARQAVLSQWSSVRELAARKLAERPVEAWAPLLLSLLETPIEARMSLYVGTGGVRLTHLFRSETQGQEQFTLLDSQTIFRRTTRQPLQFAPGSGPVQFDQTAAERTVQLSLLDAQLKAWNRQRELDARNEQIQQRNSQVCAVLRAGSRVRLPAEPQEWWTWWQDYNQLEEAGKTRVYQQDIDIQYADVYDIQEAPVPVDVAPGRDQRDDVTYECLVAGTRIWTDRGLMSVEEIQIGDLVLSRHTESGELTYQPVLKTTIRQKTAVHTLELESGTFRATGGHRFWVAGHGWKRVRDLQPEMIFHGVHGPVKLLGITPAGQETTYNLLVSEYHTYFIEPAGLLSQDVTVPAPTDARIPGLLSTERRD